MPRAHRHYLPGCIWHITHRCHKKEFLLKFGKDRDRWLSWLFEARKRFQTCILDYMITSNHIHLLVLDNGTRDSIPTTLQLVAGRTGQEYNQRKNRKGAFWEDRYHATAVQSDEHLIKCLIYIDLNMVRAGVVNHPAEWQWSGYNEIQNPRERYGLINRKELKSLLCIAEDGSLPKYHKDLIDQALKADSHERQGRWTESIAVGSEAFIEQTKERLGVRAKGRKAERSGETFALREADGSYDFGGKSGTLRAENTYLWGDIT